jgi:hypothetical protein
MSCTPRAHTHKEQQGTKNLFMHFQKRNPNKFKKIKIVHELKKKIARVERDGGQNDALCNMNAHARRRHD